MKNRQFLSVGKSSELLSLVERHHSSGKADEMGAGPFGQGFGAVRFITQNQQIIADVAVINN